MLCWARCCLEAHIIIFYYVMLALQYIRYYVLATLFSASISFSLRMWPVFDSDWKTHTFYFSSPSQRKNGYSIRKMAMPIDKAHVTFTRSLFSTFSFSGCQKWKSQFLWAERLLCAIDMSYWRITIFGLHVTIKCTVILCNFAIVTSTRYMHTADTDTDTDPDTRHVI